MPVLALSPVPELSQADRFPIMLAWARERELEDLTRQMHDLQRHMKWFRAVGAAQAKQETPARLPPG
jgi:hypothetical protein